MARKKDPGWVTTGKRGKGFSLLFPVVHPPHCVCAPCSDPARRPPETRERDFAIRVNRQSPHPTSLNRSIAHARVLKQQLEEELRAAITAAQARHEALSGPTLRVIADGYAQHQVDEGKRYDRDRYVIEAIVGHFGELRDPTTITKADYLGWCAAMKRTACHKRRSTGGRRRLSRSSTVRGAGMSSRSTVWMAS